MDFAKSLMKKYGWKEGDGLGKNNDGINQPLRANFKFDNAGFGHDRATDFNNHWWERVYNDAANNLTVENAEKNVSVKTKSPDALEISTKEYSVNKLKKLTGAASYNNFLKSATLSASGQTDDPNRINMDDISVSTFQPLNDEELFAACGGRTAHKGARHGLKLSGKLARIEQQEKELLEKLQKRSTITTDELEYDSWQTMSKIKKKRKRRVEETITEQQPQQENQDELADLLDNTEYVTSKKKRKENSKRDKELSSCLLAFSVDDNKLDEDGDTVLEGTFSTSTGTKKRKKRKRKRKSIYEPIVDEVLPPTGKESIDELDDQLTVNSLEVNISDSEQSTSQSTKKTKSKKVKKREKRIMKQLVSTLENSVIITD